MFRTPKPVFRLPRLANGLRVSASRQIAVKVAIAFFLVSGLAILLPPLCGLTSSCIAREATDAADTQISAGVPGKRAYPGTRAFRFPDDYGEPAQRALALQSIDSIRRREGRIPVIEGFMRNRILHLTFDDGPARDTTTRILDTLSAYNLRATFFVVGKQLFGDAREAHRDLLRRMADEGHTVAMHSFSHADFRLLTDLQISRELRRAERMVIDILGYHPKLFRPPYGSRDDRTAALLTSSGYLEILWNIAPDEFGARTPWEIGSNFHAALTEQEGLFGWRGGIVLLHDNRPATADALLLLIEDIRRRNCLLLAQDGEELWDVVGDLSYFLLYGNELPEELVDRRQNRARAAASKYCTEPAGPGTTAQKDRTRATLPTPALG